MAGLERSLRRMERAGLALGLKAPRLKDAVQMLRTAAQRFVLL